MAETRRRGTAAALIGVVVVGALAVWMLKRGDDSPQVQPASGSAPAEVAPEPEEAEEAEDAGPLVVEPEMSPERVDELVEQTFVRTDEVEPLAPERLMPFLPGSVGSLKRAEASGERSGAAGIETATARARYLGQGQDLELQVVDLGGPKGVAAFAAWALVNDQDNQGPTGYEKVYREGERVHYEAWNSEDSRGQQSVLLGGRFAVTVSGTAESAETLAAALEAVDVDAIEKLK